MNQGILIQGIGYVGDGGTDKPHRVRGAAPVLAGAMGGEGLPEPRGQGQAGGGYKVGNVQRVLGPRRRGSLHSSCRYRKRTATAGDITVFH